MLTATQKAEAEKAAKELEAKKAAEALALAEAEKAKKKPAADEESDEEKAKKAAEEKAYTDGLAEAEKALAEATEKASAAKGKMPPWMKGKDGKDKKEGDKKDAEKDAKKAIEPEVAVEKGMSPKEMLVQMMADEVQSKMYKLQQLLSMDCGASEKAMKSMPPEVAAGLEIVAKAGKPQFSADRNAKFNDALKTLLSLSGEVNSEELQKMLATLSGGDALQKGGENNPKPALNSKTEPEAPSSGAGASASLQAQKAIDDAVAKAIAETTAKLTKEIEDLKAARATTKALGADETEVPVTKKGASLWTGLL